MEEQEDKEIVELPEYIGSTRVKYRLYEEKTSPLIFLVVVIVVVCLLYFRKREKQKEEVNKRKQELKYDYSEVVLKLTLLLGAGMTTRRAWQKIVDDYMLKREKKQISKRWVYEEMYETECNIKAGISEIQAYERFASRCDTKEYMKLATLLQTNIKKGTKELRVLLEQEAEEAFEERKNLAKKKGEEASTKLLFPMMLMLLIVMAIIMVPAMMTFG